MFRHVSLVALPTLVAGHAMMVQPRPRNSIEGARLSLSLSLSLSRARARARSLARSLSIVSGYPRVSVPVRVRVTSYETHL